MRMKRWSLIAMAVLAVLVIGIGGAVAAPSAQVEPDPPVDENGSARPPAAFSGARIGPLTEDLRIHLGLPEDVEGVVVMAIAPEGPAAEAGLHRGNVITSADGHAITSPDDVHSILAAKHPGDELELTVLQEGAETTVTVVLGEAPPHHPGPDRPQRLPEWLGKLGALLHAFPSLVDGELRLPRDDGTITVEVTVGAVLETGDGWLVVEKQTGETAQFELTDDSLVIKNLHPASLDDLAEGDRVVVVVVSDDDGETVKAVVAGRLRPGQGQPPGVGPHRGVGRGHDRAVPAEAQERLEQLRERLNDTARDRVAGPFEAIEQRLQEVEARLERLENAGAPVA